jgi:hypothetical protein
MEKCMQTIQPNHLTGKEFVVAMEQIIDQTGTLPLAWQLDACRRLGIYIYDKDVEETAPTQLKLPL